MVGRYLLLLVATVIGLSAAKPLHRPYANHGDILEKFLQSHRELQGVVRQANCGLLEQAFSQQSWENSTCSCRGSPGNGNDEVIATCIDNFECCAAEKSADGKDICVTNSFQQVIDKKTFAALDTTEYFHYTSGRTGTITLFHLEAGGTSTCSLHVDRTRCLSCEVIECQGDSQPLFDCSNIPGGGVFDYCPDSAVNSLTTDSVIGVLQDGFMNFQFPFVEGEGGCRLFEGHITAKLGGLHDLMGGVPSGGRTMASGVTMALVASALSGMWFL